MKKTLTAAAAGALLLGVTPLWMANAYTPTAEAACADDVCSISLPDEMFTAGTEFGVDYEIAGGSTVDLAVWAVTEGESGDVLEQGPLTLGDRLAGPQTATGPLGSVSFTVPADTDGTAFIVAPADLDVAGIDHAIPTVPGGSRISVRDLRSVYGADQGFTIGADVFNLNESGTLDISDIDDSAMNVFMSSVQFGVTGDVYGIEANFDGAWTNIAETGTIGGADVDAARTVGANGSANVTWKVPAGTLPGSYQVRLVNETADVTLATVRAFTVTGETATPTPSPSVTPSVSPAPSVTPSQAPSQAPVATDPAVEEVHYENCADVAAKVGFQLTKFDPGYRAGLDSDSDGVACEDLPKRVIGVPGTGV